MLRQSACSRRVPCCSAALAVQVNVPRLRSCVFALLQMQEHKLDTRLKHTASKLAELDQEHVKLKSASTQKLQEMAERIQDLQRECQDLQV